MREYTYVGPRHLKELAHSNIARHRLESPEALARWLRENLHEDSGGAVTLTYVVRTDGSFWVSDRHSEHIACAEGGPVLGAGEVTFRDDEVEHISNQSTGFCPEPSCWSVVRDAIASAGFEAPPEFSHEFEFRRCDRCAQINIVKDDIFECASCGSELSTTWNFDRLPTSKA